MDGTELPPWTKQMGHEQSVGQGWGTGPPTPIPGLANSAFTQPL